MASMGFSNRFLSRQAYCCFVAISSFISYHSEFTVARFVQCFYFIHASILVFSLSINSPGDS